MQPLLMGLICVTLLCWSIPAKGEQVINVHDGDTFTLENGDRIRLGGIDAPELGQPYSEESRDYLARLVKDREVMLQCDGTMSYNRRVCSAFVVGLDIKKELVGWGLAYDWPKYSGGIYRHAEVFARKMKRGVWSLPDGDTRPWIYRRMKKHD